MWRWVGGHASRVFRLGGFICWISRVRFGDLIRTHSQRETWGECLFPMPYRFAYSDSSSEWWVGSPVGQYLFPSRPSSIVTWDCASTLSLRLVSAEPRALTATRPLGHSLVFPHLDVRRVYLVDSFIARDPQHNTHTTLLALTLSGHNG